MADVGAVAPGDGGGCGCGCVSVTGGVGVSCELAARAVPAGESTEIAASIGSAGLISGIGRGNTVEKVPAPRIAAPGGTGRLPCVRYRHLLHACAETR